MYFSSMPHTDEAASSTPDSKRPPQVYHGWALAAIIEFDRITPGLLAASFRFGVKRRQAVFFLLGLVEVLGLDEVVAHLRQSEHAAEFKNGSSAYILGQALLRLRRPRDLVGAIVSGPPPGLAGALSRLGNNPCAPRTYYELARVHLSKNPEDRRRAKVLGQIEGGLVGAQIEILSKLDPVLLHPALVSKLYDVGQVDEIHHGLHLIRRYCSGASDDALHASLKRLRRDGHRTDLVKSWACRFDRLPHHLDVNGDKTLIVLSSAAEMVAAGRRYKNCLKTKIYEVFLGTCLFVEYHPDQNGASGAIAELRRTNQGFLLHGLYAADNRRVRADRADLIRRKLISCGVAVLDHAPVDREAVRATARMLDQWTLGDPDNDCWGDEPLDAVADLREALEVT